MKRRPDQNKLAAIPADGNLPASAPGELLALSLSANCAAYRGLSNAVRGEFWKVCSVLPDLVAARFLQPACRDAARASGLSAKNLYERVRKFQATQAWLTLVDRRRAGPSLWKSSKPAAKITPSLAAAVRKARVRQGLMNSLSEEEQHQLFTWFKDGLTTQAVRDRLRNEWGIRATPATLRRFKLNFSAGRLPAPDPVVIRLEIVGNGKVVVAKRRGKS